MPDLSIHYGSLKLKSPVIAGSSGLCDSMENLLAFEKYGAGAVVLKSLFEEEIIRDRNIQLSGMASSNLIYPETTDYYNYFEGPSENTTHYLEMIRKAKSALSIPVIASINCIDAENWIYFPKQIEQAGADGLELNIFIFPSGLKGSSEENENIYFNIIKLVKSQLKIPVFIKLSFYSTNLTAFLHKISQTGIDGIVLFNRFYNPDIDIDSLEITSGGILSSAGDIYHTLRWIGIMAGRSECALIASTGVHSPEAAIKLLLAGATAVQVASVCYKNGIPFIKTIVDGIDHWMEQKKFKTIKDFNGKLSQSSTENPSIYSRVQFMKYYRGFEKTELY